LIRKLQEGAMSSVFVTGASGFIGGAIAQKFAQTHNVYAMARSEASADKIRALGAEPVLCDLDSLAPGDLPACDAVVHAAAWVSPWGSREDYWRANVDGTDRVLAAARAAGASRFIHISTEAVLWRGQDLRDIDESHPYPERTPILYAETKGEAERRVLAANAPGIFETLAVRPRMVWGPGDTTVVPEAIKMVEQGAFAWVDGGRAKTSTTHIDNLVHGVALALERGAGGEVYFLTDGEVSDFKGFFTRLLGAHGVTLPDRSVPSWLARPVAAAVEGAWRALGLTSTPPLMRHTIGLLACDCTINDAKARSELGYAPVTTVAEGLARLASD
jgi:nucleoside-diphosphate-sugar epimerase